MAKAMIAMSGGVDSSVAAYLMQEAGFDCIGGTMLLCDETLLGKADIPSPARDASLVAERLHMPFYAFEECSNLTSITIENPECKIYDSKVTISDTATIYGYAGSTAESYAEKYDRDFIALSNETNILLGDVNDDGTISIDDAQLTLLEYVNLMAGLDRTLTEQQTLAAEINGDHTISVNDAQYILAYYTDQLAGKKPSWDDII